MIRPELLTLEYFSWGKNGIITYRQWKTDIFVPSPSFDRRLIVAGVCTYLSVFLTLYCIYSIMFVMFSVCLFIFSLFVYIPISVNILLHCYLFIFFQLWKMCLESNCIAATTVDVIILLGIRLTGKSTIEFTLERNRLSVKTVVLPTHRQALCIDICELTQHAY